MHDKYNCPLHSDEHSNESLSPVKLWKDPNEWYLHGKCNIVSKQVFQISEVPNYFGLGV